MSQSDRRQRSFAPGGIRRPLGWRTAIRLDIMRLHRNAAGEQHGDQRDGAQRPPSGAESLGPPAHRAPAPPTQNRGCRAAEGRSHPPITAVPIAIRLLAPAPVEIASSITQNEGGSWSSGRRKRFRGLTAASMTRHSFCAVGESTIRIVLEARPMVVIRPTWREHRSGRAAVVKPRRPGPTGHPAQRPNRQPRRGRRGWGRRRSGYAIKAALGRTAVAERIVPTSSGTPNCGANLAISFIDWPELWPGAGFHRPGSLKR